MLRQLKLDVLLPWIAALMIIAPLGATAVTDAAQDMPAPQLIDVPHPDYTQLKADVRTRLETARGQFDRTIKAPLNDRERGIAYGRLGMHYQAHEQQAAARACYVNAALLDPGNSRWPYLIAVYHEETGELQEAAERYVQSLQLNPDNLGGTIRLALVMIQLKQVDGAAKLLREVVALEPGNAPALAGLGDLAAARDAHEDALAYYQRALRSQPEATQLTYRMGISYRAIGEIDKAREMLEQRGERIPSIRDSLLSFVQGHKLGAGFFVAEGDKAMRAGNMDSAVRLFDAAAAINPEDPRALLGLGQSLGALGDLNGAIARFALVLEIQPYNSNAHYFKGALHEINGDDDAALLHYRAAVNADENHSEASFMLANALLRKQLYDEAAVQYGRIAKSRGDAEFLYQEGIAWLAGNRCGAAQNALMAAVTVKPSDQRYIQAIARMFSVCVTAEPQRLSALDYAQRLYDAHPGLETSVTLAMAMAANGRYEDAVDYQTQAIFEALKVNATDMPKALSADLQRYRENKPAQQAWPLDHPIYAPARLTLERL